MIDKSLINESYSFTIKDANGNEMICDTLALIENDNNPIVIYTDYTMDNENKFNLYVSKVVQNNEGYTLEAIDNYEDIPEIKKALDEIWAKQNVK